MDITLLALKPPDRHPSHCQRTAWESTIKSLIDAKSPSLSNGDSIGADAVIAHLKRKIESQVNVRGEMNSILADFRKLHAGAPHWQAVPHCEAIIASLLTYPDSLCCTEDVRERLKVVFYYRDHDIYYLISV